jgi:hypothetical protein
MSVGKYAQQNQSNHTCPRCPPRSQRMFSEFCRPGCMNGEFQIVGQYNCHVYRKHAGDDQNWHGRRLHENIEGVLVWHEEIVAASAQYVTQGYVLVIRRSNSGIQRDQCQQYKEYTARPWSHKESPACGRFRTFGEENMFQGWIQVIVIAERRVHSVSKIGQKPAIIRYQPISTSGEVNIS